MEGSYEACEACVISHSVALAKYVESAFYSNTSHVAGSMCGMSNLISQALLNLEMNSNLKGIWSAFLLAGLIEVNY